jgi:hypothetical protein
MKSWRTIAAAIAALSLAVAIGCNADTVKDEGSRKPEPAVQDDGRQGAGEQEGSGEQQGSGGAGTPANEDPKPQPDEPVSGEGSAGGDEGGDSGDGAVSILPVTEPAPEFEILPVPEPVDGGPIPPEGDVSARPGGADPDAPVSKHANTP